MSSACVVVSHYLYCPKLLTAYNKATLVKLKFKKSLTVTLKTLIFRKPISSAVLGCNELNTFAEFNLNCNGFLVQYDHIIMKYGQVSCIFD